MSAGPGAGFPDCGAGPQHRHPWLRAGQAAPLAPALAEQLRKSLVPRSPTVRRGPRTFLVSCLGPGRRGTATLCAHPLVFLPTSFHPRPDSVPLRPISQPDRECQRRGSAGATVFLVSPAVWLFEQRRSSLLCEDGRAAPALLSHLCLAPRAPQAGRPPVPTLLSTASPRAVPVQCSPRPVGARSQGALDRSCVCVCKCVSVCGVCQCVHL